MPGFSAPEMHGKLSLRASVTSELVLDGVSVPEANRLPEATSLRAPLSCLNEARYGIVWGAAGAARACYEAALEYAKSREQFGKPIAGFQLTQAKLVEMAVKVGQSTLLALHLGRMKDAGTLRPEQVSFGKYHNVSAALEVAHSARTRARRQRHHARVSGPAPRQQPRVRAHLRGDARDAHADPRRRRSRGPPRSRRAVSRESPLKGSDPRISLRLRGRQRERHRARCRSRCAAGRWPDVLVEPDRHRAVRHRRAPARPGHVHLQRLLQRERAVLQVHRPGAVSAASPAVRDHVGGRWTRCSPSDARLERPNVAGVPERQRERRRHRARSRPGVSAVANPAACASSPTAVPCGRSSSWCSASDVSGAARRVTGASGRSRGRSRRRGRRPSTCRLRRVQVLGDRRAGAAARRACPRSPARPAR